jgi:hypothetical protein
MKKKTIQIGIGFFLSFALPPLQLNAQTPTGRAAIFAKLDNDYFTGTDY